MRGRCLTYILSLSATQRLVHRPASSLLAPAPWRARAQFSWSGPSAPGDVAPPKRGWRRASPTSMEASQQLSPVEVDEEHSRGASAQHQEAMHNDIPRSQEFGINPDSSLEHNDSQAHQEVGPQDALQAQPKDAEEAFDAEQMMGNVMDGMMENAKSVWPISRNAQGRLEIDASGLLNLVRCRGRPRSHAACCFDGGSSVFRLLGQARSVEVGVVVSDSNSVRWCVVGRIWLLQLILFGCRGPV